MKLHPKGRDMPHFEIRQILLGDPEVFTNMEFVEISTLPFKLRPSNCIKLDTIGNVIVGNNVQEHPSDSFTYQPKFDVPKSRWKNVKI